VTASPITVVDVLPAPAVRNTRREVVGSLAVRLAL
jgi:hypothetical protein